MKPTTEDFLLPMADIMRIFAVDDIREAAKIRIKAAIDAKASHDEECQRLADEWLLAHRDEFFRRAAEYRRADPSSSRLEFRNGLDKLWGSMRDEADPIFRDYVTQYRPQE